MVRGEKQVDWKEDGMREIGLLTQSVVDHYFNHCGVGAAEDEWVFRYESRLV